MKLKSSLLFAITAVIGCGSSALAQSAAENPILIGVQAQISYQSDCNAISCSGGDGSSCAPEVKEKNIDILDASLLKLAASPEFKNEKVFQSFLTETTQLRTADEQISAYGNIVGLNRKGEVASQKALLEFLGARDFTKYIQAAEKNLQLKPEHANTMVNVISTDLLSSSN